MHPQQPVGLGIGDELEQPARVAIDQRPRHRVQGQDTDLHVAALLDRKRGGYWRISPVGHATIKRQYVQDSNVLETHFTNDSGTAILIDLMPGASHTSRQNSLMPDHEIIRKVTCVAGEMDLQIEFCPMAEYGKSKVQIRQCGALGLKIHVSRGAYWLRSTVPLQITDGSARARIVLRSGESLCFSFSYTEEAPAVLRLRDRKPRRTSLPRAARSA